MTPCGSFALTALIKCSSAQKTLDRSRTPACAIHFIYCWQTLIIMVSGNVKNVTEEGDVIRLRVRGTGCEHYDECDVRIKKDGKRTDWFKNALGKTKLSVWWQGDKLFANFGEISGFEFEKVGNSSNGAHI